MENILEVNNLTKHYSDFCLDNVSFTLKKGCIMGFIGENGSGKSTTIKAILNIIQKEKGKVTLFGLDMNDPQNDLRAKENIGVVLDESHFHTHLTVKTISIFMSKIYKNWDEKLYYSYIDTFKLPKDKIMKDFSKGMTMKLNIAVALSHSPKLLLLDEATSGLDPIVRNEILDVFLEYIQDENRSILMSSHITTDLEKIADYITFIHNGKIVFSETKDSIIYNHGVLKCSASDYKRLDEKDMIRVKKNRFQYEVLVKAPNEQKRKYRDFTIDPATLEDIMLFYSREEQVC